MNPRLLKRLTELSRSRGVAVYLVGGCVRDRLLGRTVKDFDLALEGEVEPFVSELAAGLPGAKVKTFDRFGTARLEWDGGRVDFARTRGEIYVKPAALPIVGPANIATDLFRRDFTINAMAQPLEEGKEPLDFHGGRRDLKRKLLRVLHASSFEDDPTRIFRAARFAARFGLKLEPLTQKALLASVAAGHLGLLSRERVREELMRLLAEQNPAPAFALLGQWGALGAVGEGLAWTAATFKDPDPWVRLGLLALTLGGKGADFLDGLALERSKRTVLESALKAAARKSSPYAPLDPLALQVLKLGLPKLPAAALKPLLAGGDDLKALGAVPGPRFGEILDELARAQWAGKVRTRSEALAWIKKKRSA